ncbi:GNAT family N-acetyltransferase [Kitasatospora purpeofusca]|uniref:GNAT family N-acetyltransferase n=1 Tax=Kitasatospora purpeofusca TaxID=67352 RepID=UPI003F4A8E90
MNVLRAPTAVAIGTRVHPDAHGVDPAAWDRLVGADNFYGSHRWVRSTHLASGGDPVVTASASGVLLGVLPTWPGEGGEDEMFSLSGILPGLAAAVGGGRQLWLGTRRSVRNELVCVRGPRRRPVLRALLGRALELAADRGDDGVVMAYLAGEDALELAAAHPRARALLHSADTYLPVLPGGAGELTARADQHTRTRRRSEMRAFQRTGTVIKTTRPTEDVVARIADLIAQNRTRHGSSGGPQAVLDALNAQRATGLLDNAVAFLGLRGTDLVAATVCYEHGDRLYARYFGYDYTSTAPTNEYFLLTYHAPLDYAAECGFRRYRTAISAWDVKVRRGARLTPLAAVLLPLRGAVCTPARQREHNMTAAGRWRELAGRHLQAMGPEWACWDSPLP